MTSTINISAVPIVQITHYAAQYNSPEVDKLYQDDAVWIITSSFIIFTMHSGFGLLESGSVSAKDEVNIMVKNVVDVVFGGLSYWSVGYGLSYGDYEPICNWFTGFGRFFYDPTRDQMNVNAEGWSYAAFLFELSLATTASTIVSGAVAERAKLKSYILLGCLVILIQALPAHWVWDKRGFFYKLGVVDFAGCSAVHMVGGVIGLIATIYLKPRRKRFDEDSVHQMSSPTNALLGLFLLWWGFFGINAGAVWGITGGRWRLGARAAVATIMSSIGGGATSIVISFSKTKKLQVNLLINGILSSIVSITALCAVSRPWHALIIGSVSAAFSISVLPLLDRWHVDDPVGVVPVHLTSSIWGMIAVGIFCERDKSIASATNGNAGLLYSWSFKLLGIQLLCTLTVLVYSATMGLLVLFIISKSPLGLRVTDYEEQIGADVIEHGLAGTNVARYVVEKPLSTRTFQTVTKAIAKWKMLAKQKRRLQRLEEAKLKRETEVTAFNRLQGNGNHLNGNIPYGNHLQHRRPNRDVPMRANTLPNGTGPPRPAAIRLPKGSETERDHEMEEYPQEERPFEARVVNENEPPAESEPQPSTSAEPRKPAGRRVRDRRSKREGKYSPRSDDNPDEAGPSSSSNKQGNQQQQINENPEPPVKAGARRKISNKNISEKNQNDEGDKEKEKNKEKTGGNSSEEPSVNASRESLRSQYPRAGQRLQQVGNTGDRPTTTPNVNISVRPTTSGKFIRTPVRSAMTPPSDVSVDSLVSSVATPTMNPTNFPARNNKIAPQPSAKDNLPRDNPV